MRTPMPGDFETISEGHLPKVLAAYLGCEAGATREVEAFQMLLQRVGLVG